VAAWAVVVAALAAQAQWLVARLAWVAVLALWVAQERAQSINLATWQVSLRRLLHRL
jgi:hypothetical protein